MIRKSWAEIANHTIGSTNNFLDDLAVEIKNFICGLWAKYPSYMNSPLTALNDFDRAFMNAACAPQPPPAPPTVPFTGGQCCDLTYDVSCFYDLKRCFNNDTVSTDTSIKTVTGKILRLELRQCVNNASFRCVDLIYEDCAEVEQFTIVTSFTQEIGSTNCFTTSPFDPQAGNIDPEASILEITNVAVSGGGADTCGDPPASYPDIIPVDPADLNITVNIDNRDGTMGQYDISLITVNNDIEASLRVPITVNVGGFIADVDIGGISFNSGGGNIIFNPGGSLLPDGTKHPLPPGTTPPPPAAKEPEPNSEDYEEIEKTETDPKEEEVGNELKYVKVTLTSVPTNVKNQFGDGAPDVIYAGWFEFRGDGYNFPRQPIHFYNCLFKAPEGANGYAYTLYQGITGKATIYNLKSLE